jgi:hypothetical protein
MTMRVMRLQGSCLPTFSGPYTFPSHVRSSTQPDDHRGWDGSDILTVFFPSLLVVVCLPAVYPVLKALKTSASVNFIISTQVRRVLAHSVLLTGGEG